MKFLLAIPCFNEEDQIGTTLDSLKFVLQGQKHEIQIMVFDDGSVDNSSKIAIEKGVLVHKELYNKGLGETFKIMVEHAVFMQCDYLITCDADGQFDALDVKNLIMEINVSKPDLLIGSRFLIGSKVNNMPRARIIGNHIVSKLVKFISGYRVSDATCGLRAYSRKAVYSLSPRAKFSYTIESLIQLFASGVNVKEIPISVKYFHDRSSSISDSLFKYGAKTLFIALKISITTAFSRFLKYSSLFVFPGIFLGLLFFSKSFSSGKFSGNLYIGFIAVFLIFYSLISFILYLISIRFDEIEKINNLNYKLLLAQRNSCDVCRPF